MRDWLIFLFIPNGRGYGLNGCGCVVNRLQSRHSSEERLFAAVALWEYSPCGRRELAKTNNPDISTCRRVCTQRRRRVFLPHGTKGEKKEVRSGLLASWRLRDAAQLRSWCSKFASAEFYSLCETYNNLKPPRPSQPWKHPTRLLTPELVLKLNLSPENRLVSSSSPRMLLSVSDSQSAAGTARFFHCFYTLLF